MTRRFKLTPMLRTVLETALLDTYAEGLDHYCVASTAKLFESFKYVCGEEEAGRVETRFRRYLGELEREGYLTRKGKGREITSDLTEKGYAALS